MYINKVRLQSTKLQSASSIYVLCLIRARSFNADAMMKTFLNVLLYRPPDAYSALECNQISKQFYIVLQVLVIAMFVTLAQHQI
jgi:hypothetical protein